MKANNTPEGGSGRRRDPAGTRLRILEAAGELLARDGSEGLSVLQVAQMAGVNRGTAYQHFQSREQLLEATTRWVSEQLCQAVFGDQPAVVSPKRGRGKAASPDEQTAMMPEHVIGNMAQFAMRNPELGRAWMFHVLSSPNPASDPFWKQYRQRFERFAETDAAQPGIDIDVHTVLMIVSAFLWPVWVRAHARSAKDREEMAQRFSGEMIRLSLYGNVRPERFPELVAKLPRNTKKKTTKKKRASVSGSRK
ncbi:TetR/AcrR family transcriptional regulator [Solimonas marina]|uniref:TetR/AcrR family transcriptional regulator n=1 Tax=Solimonas marina TaxID=2714601 RepID=A0A970BAX6_9GAMM|nr:TetR/AcrR family transcriptional regulator [Solimonas marina]NKF23826.1 TetR/AcrR family transcriptional regulator [Solimonas marina]